MEQGAEAAAQFEELMTVTMSKERSIINLPFDPMNDTQPMSMGRRFPETQDGLGNFADKIWTQQDKNPHCGVKMALNKNLQFLEENDFTVVLVSALGHHVV